MLTVKNRRKHLRPNKVYIFFIRTSGVDLQTLRSRKLQKLETSHLTYKIYGSYILRIRGFPIQYTYFKNSFEIRPLYIYILKSSSSLAHPPLLALYLHSCFYLSPHLAWCFCISLKQHYAHFPVAHPRLPPCPYGVLLTERHAEALRVVGAA